MNNQRRKDIDTCIAHVEKLAELAEAVREAVDAYNEERDNMHSAIEGIREEEQEYFDNMPESFQQGDKGQTAEAAISQLDEALALVDEDIEIDLPDAESLVSYLDEAKA